MPNLTLFDDMSQNTYILEVSEEEFTRANKGTYYITYNLCNFKKKREF